MLSSEYSTNSYITLMLKAAQIECVDLAVVPCYTGDGVGCTTEAHLHPEPPSGFFL